MEILAPTKALTQLKTPCEVDLYSDSKYVISGITEWIHNWKKNNWKTASKKSVANSEFWQKLDAACGQHKIKWHWVKAHPGQKENEIVDEAARGQALKAAQG